MRAVGWTLSVAFGGVLPIMIVVRQIYPEVLGSADEKMVIQVMLDYVLGAVVGFLMARKKYKNKSQ